MYERPNWLPTKVDWKINTDKDKDIDYTAIEQRQMEFYAMAAKKARKPKKATLIDHRTGRKAKPLPSGTYTGRFVRSGFAIDMEVAPSKPYGAANWSPQEPPNSINSLLMEAHMLNKKFRSKAEAIDEIQRLRRSIEGTREEHEKALSLRDFDRAKHVSTIHSDVNKRLLDILEYGSKGEAFPRRPQPL